MPAATTPEAAASNSRPAVVAQLGGEDTLERRTVVPLPGVRMLRWHMDSCAATNKSQFLCGGMGLLAAFGILDAVQALFMVVGHTRFGPDLVARHVAGRFKREDAFNSAQLLGMLRNYSTAGVYDGDLLQT